MIKAAFAHWDSRIAPVFDVARQICLVEAESGRIVKQDQEILPDDLPVQKALRLAELGVGALVCGAISRPLHEMVSAYGIQVIPFVAGDLREVIQAWLSGGLDGVAFAMPGCCGRRRRRSRGRHSIYQEECLMNGRKRGGMGPGGGRGQHRGGQRPGRKGGASAAGPNGFCVCPQCGYREAHERGVPCVERKCPKCGAVMTGE
jgi:predicted Fe-Mo cluster-binding NifX family protein